MTVRRATDADLPVLDELWSAFERESPPPPYVEVDHEQELAEIREIVESGLAFLAERDGPVGFALARRTGPRLARLTDLYVVPAARRDGIAAELVSAAAEALHAEGIENLDLEVRSGNSDARAVYSRWGFTEQLHVLGVPLATLRERLAPEHKPPSFALDPRPDRCDRRRRARRARLRAAHRLPRVPRSSGRETAGRRSTTR